MEVLASSRDSFHSYPQVYRWPAVLQWLEILQLEVAILLPFSALNWLLFRVLSLVFSLEIDLTFDRVVGQLLGNCECCLN